MRPSKTARLFLRILHHIGKYGITTYRDDPPKKMAANRKGIGPTTLKRGCNSTTNTRTKYLLLVMHKTLCSVWLTFVRRENETVQNCLIVLQNSSSYYYYSSFAVTHTSYRANSKTITNRSVYTNHLSYQERHTTRTTQVSRDSDSFLQHSP